MKSLPTKPPANVSPAPVGSKTSSNGRAGAIYRLCSMINLGRVDKDDSEKFLLEIEMKMSDLLTNPPIFKLPKSQELLKRTC